MTDRIVLDTSVLIEGIISKRIEHDEIQPKEILIHEASISELEAQANTGRETGYLGLEEVRKLVEYSKKKKFVVKFSGDRPSTEDISFAKKGGVDSLIRNLAYDTQSSLVTVDKVQALTAEAKGIHVILIKLETSVKPLLFEHYFDPATMSIHLKENCTPKAKRGSPGSWEYIELDQKPIDKEQMKSFAKDIMESAGIRADSFIEIERKHSTVAQIGRYRIVIVRPPFADGYEITIVRPVKKLSFKEYPISDKLRKRIEEQAEGVLIAGAPGHGKSTFVQALAEYYLAKNKVIKTVEAPRDLVLSDDVTQYAISHGTYQEIHDVLLLSRPDYTVFDEMRNTGDFELYTDLRLAGVGMIGIVHATKPVDAIQRFIGRIELGVIPHVVDTVIFIKNGGIEKVFSITMEVKVPSGMTEADLARPIVVINDFESGRLEYEVYSYGEETVVVPVQEQGSLSPAAVLAARVVKEEFRKYADSVDVEMVSNNKCIVYVPGEYRASIIGRSGSNIEQIERKLGLSIDVREMGLKEKTGKGKAPSKEQYANYQIKIDKKSVNFILRQDQANCDTDVYVDDEYVMTVKSSKKAVIRINKGSHQGRTILHAMNNEGKIELRQ